MNRHPWEDAPALGCVADSQADDRVRRALRETLPVEAHGAAARAQQAADRAQGGRLAGAVGADERDDLALVDAQRDAAKGADSPVPRLDVVEASSRRHRAQALHEVGFDHALVGAAPAATRFPSADLSRRDRAR